MGVSTDAVLFYGYCWEDEEVLFYGYCWEDEEDELPDAATELWGKEEAILTGRHCSDDYSIPYIYVTESRLVAWRGSPRTVDSLDLQPGWDDLLTKFCERFEIEPPQDKPQWWLVSWWG